MIHLIKYIISPIIIGCLGYAAFRWVNGGEYLPASREEIIVLLIFITTGLGAAWVAGTRNRRGDIASERENGTVKWFNSKKGFGFILCDQGDEVFVHYRNIVKQQGKQIIEQGQRVSFVTTNKAKGLQAEEVMVL